MSEHSQDIGASPSSPAHDWSFPGIQVEDSEITSQNLCDSPMKDINALGKQDSDAASQVYTESSLQDLSSPGALGMPVDITNTIHQGCIPIQTRVQQFIQFQKLNLELRYMIWKLACQSPRAVDIWPIPVAIGNNKGLPSLHRWIQEYPEAPSVFPFKYRSHCPIPAVLHTCTEARNVAMAQYSLEFGIQILGIGEPQNALNILPRTYINWDVDTICFIPAPTLPRFETPCITKRQMAKEAFGNFNEVPQDTGLKVHRIAVDCRFSSNFLDTVRRICHFGLYELVLYWLPETEMAKDIQEGGFDREHPINIKLLPASTGDNMSSWEPWQHDLGKARNDVECFSDFWIAARGQEALEKEGWVRPKVSIAILDVKERV